MPRSEADNQHLEALGRRIRERREYLGLSQADVARALGKERYQTISLIESGTNAISALDLAKLAAFLRAPVAYFYGDLEGPTADDDVLADFRALPADQQETVRIMLRAMARESSR